LLPRYVQAEDSLASAGLQLIDAFSKYLDLPPRALQLLYVDDPAISCCSRTQAQSLAWT
jgi:hypothetical protein